MINVFVVFSGEYLLMDIKSKQLEGTLPVFRIEGVFSEQKKCESWIEAQQTAENGNMLYSFIEIPFDPVAGQKEEGTQIFSIRMNERLQIVEITMAENEEIPSDKLFSLQKLENGHFYGSFWARDFIDACKLAYVRVKEAIQDGEDDHKLLQ